MLPFRYLVLIAVACPLILHSASREKRPGVRTQLASLQQETGLALAGFQVGRVQTVEFSNRSTPVENYLIYPPGAAQDGVVSPDGSEVAFTYEESSYLGSRLMTAHRDGSYATKYPEIVRPAGFCWSSDKASIILSAEVPNSHERPPERMLQIVDLATKATRSIDLGGEATPQCWSPDRQRIVYASGSSYNASIRIYDLAQGKWKEIAHGYQPAWSPDGEWIAFLSGNTYYLVRPSGLERRILFKVKNPFKGLLWSPDSRMVAYQTLTRNRQIFDPSILTRIYVRRLEDNSRDWVAIVNMGMDFVWIQPPKDGKQ